MLKITPNIFEVIDKQLNLPEDLGADAEIGKALCGVVVPDKSEIEFANAEASKSIAARHFVDDFKDSDIYMFVVQSAWQSDTTRMRYLGLKPDFLEFESFNEKLIASECLVSDEGGIRHAGLVAVPRRNMNQALAYISERQRYAFIVVDVFSDASPSHILEMICSEGIKSLLNDKRTPYFSWRRLGHAAVESRLILVTSIGWNEEYCDFRFLALGSCGDLKELLVDVPREGPQRVVSSEL